ncbi:hypothetical protein B0O99DRAFT_688170 [Bisporella sp. PMI_857]|nr:hypothetical protein B0O99DRAFT_688170 [Bisporella sp. PMI_857]
MAHRDEAVWGTMTILRRSSGLLAISNILILLVKLGIPPVSAQFCMKGRPSSFFPYGGGHVMCPGRHFAKQEILLTLAILITKFDMEFLDWTTMDGKKSDKPAHDDGRYAGIIAMPPDREMKIRWKKRW